MVVLNKRSFILPRVERGKFIRLLRLGLEYDRNLGSFSIKNYEKIEELVDTISSILNDEIKFLQNCIMCKKVFPCFDCKYDENCSTKNLTFECVCMNCLIDGKTSQQKIL